MVDNITKFNETHWRTIAKAVSWRLVITISHIVNAFIATGSLLMGLKIAGIATIINGALYWLHERAWNSTQWNRWLDTTKNFSEGQQRAVAKIISWRIFITTSNFVIPFIATGSWGSAVIFAGLATVVNMVLYWGHERIWNFFGYGRQVIVKEKTATA